MSRFGIVKTATVFLNVIDFFAVLPRLAFCIDEEGRGFVPCGFGDLIDVLPLVGGLVFEDACLDELVVLLFVEGGDLMSFALPDLDE